MAAAESSSSSVRSSWAGLGFPKLAPRSSYIYTEVQFCQAAPLPWQFLPTQYDRETSGLADRQTRNEAVAGYVEDEFRAYLRCGIMCHGFARARCSGCGHAFLIAFSHKRGGVCPACNGRRMAQTAAHLVDHVIPPVPVRQWVVSIPKRLRGFLADRPQGRRCPDKDLSDRDRAVPAHGLRCHP